MKRNFLTTAVIASIAGVAGICSVANAVSLNPDGLSNVAFYPAYSVESNQSPTFTVVDAASESRTVKVRFPEGRAAFVGVDINASGKPSILVIESADSRAGMPRPYS